MGRKHLRNRISMDPEVHRGDACIKGTRVPASVIVGSVARGSMVREILRGYPTLPADDIGAALLFAAEAVRGFDHLPLPAEG